jgi:hypothetical protein
MKKTESRKSRETLNDCQKLCFRFGRKCGLYEFLETKFCSFRPGRKVKLLLSFRTKMWNSMDISRLNSVVSVQVIGQVKIAKCCCIASGCER